LKKKATVIIITMILLLSLGIFVSEAALNDDDPLISLSYLNMVIEELKDSFSQDILDQDDAISLVKEDMDKAKTKIEDLNTEIETLTDSIDENNDSTTSPSEGLVIVELFATEDLMNNSGKSETDTGTNRIHIGNNLIGDAGTEIILRYSSSSTNAITSDLGGLSDITAGVDLANGEAIPKNHLLIIPRSDGRGVIVNEYAIFMVRGSYTVN
jgi:hypothetical protein